MQTIKSRNTIFHIYTSKYYQYSQSMHDTLKQKCYLHSFATGKLTFMKPLNVGQLRNDKYESYTHKDFDEE
jgi:hypothetical protein